jgi:predicted transcriptional regulator YheO
VTAVFSTFEELDEFLAPVMEGIAKAVGPYCEVVLHDLSKKELGSSIRRIENGHVTGRSVGGPSTNLGLELLSSLDGEDPEAAENANQFGYLARAGNGNELRCSSVYFQDGRGDLLGALCINVNLTIFQMLQQGLNSILKPAAVELAAGDHGTEQEIFATDVDGLLESMLETAIAEMSVPVSMMSKTDRVEVFRYLDKRGAFFIKHSVPKTAKRLGVSKVSAYSYLEKARQSPDADDLESAPAASV